MKLSTKSLLMVLALSTAASAQGNEVPADLMHADKLMEQLMDNGEEAVLDDSDALEAETLRPHPPRPRPRPEPRPRPRPEPRPRPRPWPVPPHTPPYRTHFTCYAEDVYGRVFRESGFRSPRYLQRRVMEECHSYSGSWCRELGCRRN